MNFESYQFMAEQSLDYRHKTQYHFKCYMDHMILEKLNRRNELPKPLLDRIGEVFVNTVERNIRRQLPAVLRKLDHKDPIRPLPKIDNPTYTLDYHQLIDLVKYRPFLVKEQKILKESMQG